MSPGKGRCVVPAMVHVNICKRRSNLQEGIKWACLPVVASFHSFFMNFNICSALLRGILPQFQARLWQEQACKRQEAFAGTWKCAQKGRGLVAQFDASSCGWRPVWRVVGDCCSRAPKHDEPARFVQMGLLVELYVELYRTKFKALCAAATICVDWAFIFPNGAQLGCQTPGLRIKRADPGTAAAGGCARLRHGPSRLATQSARRACCCMCEMRRIEPRTSQEGLAQVTCSAQRTLCFASVGEAACSCRDASLFIASTKEQSFLGTWQVRCFQASMLSIVAQTMDEGVEGVTAAKQLAKLHEPVPACPALSSSALKFQLPQRHAAAFCSVWRFLLQRHGASLSRGVAETSMRGDVTGACDRSSAQCTVIFGDCSPWGG